MLLLLLLLLIDRDDEGWDILSGEILVSRVRAFGVNS